MYNRINSHLRVNAKICTKHKDELIKIAGNLASFERLRENEAYLRLDFYKFILSTSIQVCTGGRAAKLVCFFFVTFFLQTKKKV
jgi:hypothetical protein